MAGAHIRFSNDIQEYEPSDSEDDYTEKDKILLKNYRTSKQHESESEEEVYKLGQSESSDEDVSDIAESDIEGQEDDDLPDERAWGVEKRTYYSTDYVDQDYGGYQGKDAQAADIEEEEARNIQKRLIEQLDDDDFSLDIFHKKIDTADEKQEETIKSDLSNLSKRQLLDILQKESPEYFNLIEDFKVKMGEVKNYLMPIIQQEKEGKIKDCYAMKFVRSHFHLILNYCTNIYMYLLLKASKITVQAHPIVKRLYQYRQLLAQLEPVYKEIVRPQLEIMIEMDAQETGKTSIKKKKTKKLKILEQLDKKIKDKNIMNEMESQKNIKSILKSQKTEQKKVSFEDSAGEEKMDIDSEKESENEQKEGNDDENTKRAITYQMAKNKGLTPRRNKEQRNPRVKHRNKYRKAKIRRKGAVREVRTEMTRYGGELSGIKASVSKSVKFK